MAKYVKDIKFDKEARSKLLEGVEVVAKAVSATLGPRSRTVAIDITPNYDVAPTVLKDGVSVARSINLKDVHADMGARLLKQAALKTVKDVGDGTTLTTIIAHTLIKESYKLIEAGYNPMLIKQELETGLETILQKLKEISKPVTTDKEKEQVASISASDEELGKVVSEALIKVGDNGAVTVEEGNTTETTVDYKQGLNIDKGYISPYFVTSHDREESIIENPYILITDRTISYSHEILPFLEKFVKETGSKNLVIFTSGANEEGLATLVANKLRGNINVCAIQAPAFGGRRIDELGDIATITGGTTILLDSGRQLDSVTIDELGRADKVISGRDNTIILGGKGEDKAVGARIKELTSQIKNAPSEFDAGLKQDRLANLSGSIAVINVGGRTDIEVKEKKERVIDAVAATKAAVEEGIVAGGEITLLNLASQASEMPVAGRIFLQALSSPFKKLLYNAGLDFAFIMQELKGQDYPIGINVVSGKVENLIDVGIIDPVKVIRCALENAVSVASMCITTEVLITDEWSEDISK